MKKLGLLLCFLGAMNAIAQTTTTSESDSSVAKTDTTFIRFDEVDILIVSKEGKKESNFTLSDSTIEYSSCDDCGHDNDFFHWSGFDLFLNGHYVKDVPSDVAQYTALDQKRSIGFSINFLEKRFPIFKEYVGIGTGLGASFYSYSSLLDTVTVVNPGTTFNSNAYPKTYKTDIRQNIFLGYVQVPLMLQFNTSTNYNKSFHFAVGAVGGYNISASLNQSFDAGDQEFEMESDFDDANPWQLEAMVRFGYKNLTIFGGYDLLRLDKDVSLGGTDINGRGLHAFRVGLQLVSF